MEIYGMAVKDAIKKMRHQFCMTQGEFGELFDVDKTVISAYENGRQKPRLTRIRQMVDEAKKRGLDFNYTDLIDEE